MNNFSDDEDDKFNPTNVPGENVWEPHPEVVAKLFWKLEKEGGILELDWKSPGRISQSPTKATDEQLATTPSGPTDEEIKAKERLRLLNMFEEDDLNDQIQAPVTPNIVKTPKQTKTPSQKASFDKIFNKVSAQSKDSVGDL